MKRLNVNLSDEIHAELKSWCAGHEMSMGSVLLEFIYKVLGKRASGKPEKPSPPGKAKSDGKKPQKAARPAKEAKVAPPTGKMSVPKSGPGAHSGVIGRNR